jgi:epoxyqueuosine reductase
VLVRSNKAQLTDGEAALLKKRIHTRGLEIGFDEVGFAPVELPREAPRLEQWLELGYEGDMRWMAREPTRRTDARRSHSEAQTVVCCALNYYQGAPEGADSTRGVVSSYARGEDYHRVMGKKLEGLGAFIEETCDVETKHYVDTGPLLEKGYGAASGLGWLGKHSNLISRRGSSWFFLGEILVPLALPPDAVESNLCGTCTRCIVACPTDAIVEPYVVDSRKCISYLTIERRGSIPRELRSGMGNHIYGCDDCQDVCPWNRFAQKSEEARFFPRDPLASMELVSILKMSLVEFQEATRHSAVRRARYAGFLRNVAVALGNSKNPQVVPDLAAALDHTESLVREHVAWALGNLKHPDAKEPLVQRLKVEEEPSVREEIRWSLNQFGH